MVEDKHPLPSPAQRTPSDISKKMQGRSLFFLFFNPLPGEVI
jgi:hypothetical protein